MQISPASLLAAQQQAKPPSKHADSAFGSILGAPASTPPPAGAKAFEPPTFAAKEPAEAAQTAAPAPASQTAPVYRRPGSTLDIRV